MPRRHVRQVAIFSLALAIALTSLGLARALRHAAAFARTPLSAAARVSSPPLPETVAAINRPTSPPAVSATPTPSLPQTHTAGLAVSGTQIVDTLTGRPITLIGATRSGLEYSCTGDGHFLPADFAAMRAWGMNVVRLTLSSEFWANHAGTCPGYRDLVRGAVTAAEARNLYVMLVLQWNAPFDLPADRLRGGVQCPMPDAGQDVAFWRDLATIYHSDHRVLFDLLGEPHDISFDTWYNGGTITHGCDVIGAGGGEEVGTYRAIGMRDLVGVVRDIAPDNVLILGGTNWGYDLSGLSTGHAVPGRNILYGTHPWNYAGKQPQDWDHAFGALAATYPIIASEFGAYDCSTSYVGQAIGYFTQHGMSWLAWSWNLGGCRQPALIADWSGTPTAYGAFIRARMLSAQQP